MALLGEERPRREILRERSFANWVTALWQNREARGFMGSARWPSLPPCPSTWVQCAARAIDAFYAGSDSVAAVFDAELKSRQESKVNSRAWRCTEPYPWFDNLLRSQGSDGVYQAAGLSSIQLQSWRYYEQGLTPKQIAQELKRIGEKPKRGPRITYGRNAVEQHIWEARRKIRKLLESAPVEVMEAA